MIFSFSSPFLLGSIVKNNHIDIDSTNKALENTRKYRSEKTRILAYFTQSGFFFAEVFSGLSLPTTPKNARNVFSLNRKLYITKLYPIFVLSNHYTV